MPYDQETLDSLTPEEREGLLDDSDTETTDKGDANVNESEQQAADEPAEQEAATGAAADDPDANDDAGAAQPAVAVAVEPEAQAATEPVAKEVAPSSAPVLILAAPEDAAAKLADIARQKAELAQKCDDGDVTMAQFQKENDALNEQHFELKSQVREYELAQKMEQQRIQSQWIADGNAFVAQYPEYKEGSPTFDAERAQLLDAALMGLAKIPANQGMDNRTALAKAHKMVKGAYGEVDAAPAPAEKPRQTKVPVPNAPPNLANLPTAQMNDTSGGEFASLLRLQSSDPIAYEEKLMAMSDAQRDRFLRS